MKLRIRHALGLALLAAAAPVAASDAHLTAEERQSAVAALESSQRELEALLAEVGPEQWAWKPAPEKWSIGEVAEHILLSEHYIYAGMERALAGEANPDWRQATAGKMERIREFMPNRGIKAQAPGPLEPTGELGREACLEQFAAARERTLELARTTELPVKQHTAPHPAEFFGEMNVYQWLHFVAAHNARHNQQIEEVQALMAAAKAAA